MTNMKELTNEFLEAASSTDKWTASPNFKRIVYKGKTGYMDMNFRGKRIRYCLEESLLQRCKRLWKSTNNPYESALFERVVELLGNLETKQQNNVS